MLARLLARATSTEVNGHHTYMGAHMSTEVNGYHTWAQVMWQAPRASKVGRLVLARLLPRAKSTEVNGYHTYMGAHKSTKVNG